ncbi:hypothetical protein [Brevundimonas sp.]|uniref:hypothetical protein n=1 Tax=Brevundimonas sp. TaxID=1871086 RepID=UPI0025B83241|nr:hypothetical protein [Brevundimonas sp.]
MALPDFNITFVAENASPRPDYRVLLVDPDASPRPDFTYAEVIGVRLPDFRVVAVGANERPDFRLAPATGVVEIIDGILMLDGQPIGLNDDLLVLEN